MTIINKNTLNKAVIEYFKDYVPLCYVTLNSKIVLKNKYQIEEKSALLDRKIQVVMRWMKNYIVGKSNAERVKAFAFYEAGTANSVLHAHIIVAIKGNTTRAITDIDEFLKKKWQRLRNSDSLRAPSPVLSEKLKKMLRWISIAKSDSLFPWERETLKDNNVHVRDVPDIEKAVCYSSKDFMRSMQAQQFCSYMPM
jgi:hypothetical protein